MANEQYSPVDAASEESLPRMKLGEAGFTGLKTHSGHIYEECKADLRWPNSIKTYKLMSSDAVINSAITMFEMMVKRVDWELYLPPDADEEAKAHTERIKEFMGDMEHSWRDFIQQLISYRTYGFSVHEKVFRKRTYENGSKYNDGLIAWKKLPIRAQDTIDEWIFSSDGRELRGCKQNLKTLSASGQIRYKNLANTSDGKITLPRKKFLLFRSNPQKDNPEGQSPLAAVYTAYRYRCTIEDSEASGVQRDLNGLPFITVPPKYLDVNASVEDKAFLEQLKEIGRNIRINEQGVVIFPSLWDGDARAPLFDFKLLSTEAGKLYDTSKVIER